MFQSSLLSKLTRERFEIASKPSRECLVKAGYKIQDLNKYQPNTSTNSGAFGLCLYSTLAVAYRKTHIARILL